MAAMIKPVLFNTSMVTAILEGQKTVTRRLMKPQPIRDGEMLHWKDCQWMDGGLGFPQSGVNDHAPIKVGNVLWVRETWAKQFGIYWHRAGLDIDENGYCKDGYWQNDIAAPGGKIYIATKAPEKWRPAIHMPKEAARLFLRVTDMRAERLHDIDADGIRAEGLTSLAVCVGDIEIAKQEFAILWNDTVKKGDHSFLGWDANPWVWRIAFERCDKPEDWPGGGA